MWTFFFVESLAVLSTMFCRVLAYILLISSLAQKTGLRNAVRQHSFSFVDLSLNKHFFQADETIVLIFTIKEDVDYKKV